MAQVQDPAARRGQTDRATSEEEKRFQLLINERNQALKEVTASTDQIQSLNRDLQSARELAQQAKSRYQLALEAISQQTAKLTHLRGESQAYVTRENGGITSNLR